MPSRSGTDVEALEAALSRERALVDVALALGGVGDPGRIAEIAATAAVPTLAPWCLIVAGDGRATPQVGAAHQSPAALGHVRALVDAGYHCVVALADTDTPGAARAIDAAYAAQYTVDPAQNAALVELGAAGVRAGAIVRAGALRGFAIAGVAPGPTSPAVEAAATESFRRFTQIVERALAVAGEGSRNPALKQHDAIAIAMHNLRNPLNGIYMAAGELAKRIPPDLAHYVEIVRKSARRLNRLVHDLGELAAADGGRLRVELAPEDPGPLIREVAASFAGDATKKGTDLRVELAEPLPSVPLDADRFRQVLADLVDNAIKFGAAPGRGPIVVRAAVRDRTLEVSVVDRGSGIAATDLPRVFDRFWMANRADRAGNGLGLSIAKELVEAHGGTLRVESTAGDGTTATATFPLGAA